MGKINNLNLLRKDINSFKINGVGNFSSNEVNIFVANHNCLMDIFYLPMAIPFEVVSLISARLLFKKEIARQDMVNKYLNGLPIEAHGGIKYTNVCLDAASEMLRRNISLCIFPEGAYVEENKIFRGRTGAIRLLFRAYEEGIKVNLIPVAIDIKNPIEDLDDFDRREDDVEVSFLRKINYEDLHRDYMESTSYQEKNKILHQVTDEAMKTIAFELQRTYENKYITLRPKGNVIYSDGSTIDVEEAQKVKYLTRYKKDIVDIQGRILSDI